MGFIQVGDMLVADWFFYGLIGVFGIIFGIVVWWFYNTRLKIGYRAVLTELLMGVPVQGEDGVVKLVGGVRKIVARKEFKVGDKDVTIKKTKCVVDMTKPAYMDYGWTNFYYDKDGSMLTFGGIYEKVSPTDMDNFLADNLITRFIRNIRDSPKDIALLVVMCLVVGGMMFALGLLTSPYVMPLQNSTMATIFTP